MAHPEGREKQPMRSEKDVQQQPRRFRLELGVGQLALYGCLLVGAFAWMFILGLLVGRGVPLVGPDDTSPRAQILRFLGLGNQPPPLPERASETWDGPEAKEEAATDLASTPDAQSDSPVQKPAARPPASAQNKSAQKEKDTPPPAAEASAEHYTLMVSSLRSRENAERFAEQLKGKGYDARTETIDKPDVGRWNRVLVGHFGSREEASAFASQFNKKERMQGLVIREGS